MAREGVGGKLDGVRRRDRLVDAGEHDGRPNLRLEDALLLALIREHPEKDPAKIK